MSRIIVIPNTLKPEKIINMFLNNSNLGGIYDLIKNRTKTIKILKSM